MWGGLLVNIGVEDGVNAGSGVEVGGASVLVGGMVGVCVDVAVALA